MTESKYLQEFISEYLERGFGSMNKNDFEVWIFHYLMKHQLQEKTNYEVSLFLKIPETKVKRLRYEAELKYNDGDSLENYYKVCALLKTVHFKKGGHCIQFTIEDLYLRKYLDSTLKSGGRFSDSSFNSEIVSMDYEDLEYFLGIVPEEKLKLQDLLNDARKKLKNEKLTFSYLLGELAESAVKEIGKQAVDVSIVGLLSFVRQLII